MLNHGVPISVMGNMLDDMRQFHEQPHKVKKAWYCRKESGQRIFDYNTNVKVVAWRDTVAKVTSEHMKCILQLKETLCGLLSEALGLRRDYIASIQGMKGALVACHYYPACPEPGLTFGSSCHTDASFLIILLET
ncbi:hypothetical protein QQP08_021904 [Theobroma cacao]|nr:hypothetical protein QQP08_021904 [Theobroma cacao]